MLCSGSAGAVVDNEFSEKIRSCPLAAKLRGSTTEPLRGKENWEPLLYTPPVLAPSVRRKHYPDNPVFTHPAAIEWPRPHRTITIRTSLSCVTAIVYDLRLSNTSGNCCSRQRLPLPLNTMHTADVRPSCFSTGINARSLGLGKVSPTYPLCLQSAKPSLRTGCY
ncbi:hypothetical protein BJV78DRAFT_417974 [Lactifluus subvellereus]|nr:hypothetical protein BJV78DRAFT_417974 [Lactifluus subvellereus]